MFGSNPFGSPFFGQGPIDEATGQDLLVPFIGSTTALYAPAVNGTVDVPFIASVTTFYPFQLPLELTFIASATSVYTPALIGAINVPFIASVTTVYELEIPVVPLPFIASATVVYDLQLPVVPLTFIASVTTVYALEIPVVPLPFIASRTRVFGVFSLFTDLIGSGPGNGGELFAVRLAPNGTSETATLDVSITSSTTLLRLTGDGGLPTDAPFCVTIDDEVLYVVAVGGGVYRVRGRGVSNTTAAAHAASATVTWTDSYDMAIRAGADIAHEFTADITSTGSYTYPGWLICFDATQAYRAGSRYPMHVTEVVGVFDAGAGSSGPNRCDAAQPAAIATTAATSDNCPAALSNPSRISSDILIGDVALVRYTNPEAVVLDLGSRSAALQSWFGLKRVDDTDVDVTFTDPTGHVVDGTVNGEWLNPLGPGIAPSTGEPTSHDVPYTSVTLPGTDRTFTYGPPRFSEKGWPICALAVRHGDRRIPLWQSWDWHNFNFVYSGFAPDATYCQILINRNGIVFGSVPEVALPGPQDIDGPDVVWDDGDYYFAASWYVVIYSGPYVVAGPSIGGNGGGGGGGGGADPSGFVPVVGFPGGPGGPPSIFVPTVEGGSGGGIPVPSGGRELFEVSIV